MTRYCGGGFVDERPRFVLGLRRTGSELVGAAGEMAAVLRD